MDKELVIIGHVRSNITSIDSAPKMEHEPGAAQVRVEIDPKYLVGLDTLVPGQKLELFTWLHKANRETLRVHPRGNPATPMRGVFNTRSPSRPNPIGLHRVNLVAIEDETILVIEPLEAIDGTPVIDIKPIPKDIPR